MFFNNCSNFSNIFDFTVFFGIWYGRALRLTGPGNRFSSAIECRRSMRGARPSRLAASANWGNLAQQGVLPRGSQFAYT